MVTGQHPLLTPDGWRPIAEIESGETIALAGRIPSPLLPVPLAAAEIDLLAVLLAEGGYTQHSVLFTTASPEILDLATQGATELGMTVRPTGKYTATGSTEPGPIRPPRHAAAASAGAAAESRRCSQSRRGSLMVTELASPSAMPPDANRFCWPGRS
jgi:hypothetical protein